PCSTLFCSVSSTSSTGPYESIVTIAATESGASSSNIVVVSSSSTISSSSSSTSNPIPALSTAPSTSKIPGSLAASSQVKMCSCDNQNLATSTAATTSNGNKRKRRLSSGDSNDDAKDPELGFEPPSAKRLQRLPVIYSSDQSNLSSVASSVYTSPVVSADGQSSTQELLSIRSSPADELPEAPNSPLPDSPDSPPSPDRGINGKQAPVVVRYDVSSVPVAESEAEQPEEDFLVDDSCEDYSYDEDEENDDDDDDDDEEINSSTESPASSADSNLEQPVRGGERTPRANHGDSQYSAMKQKLHMPLNDLISFECMSPAVETPLRQCPLPALAWANAADVWQLMCQRDEQDSRLRSTSMLEQHSGLQPRMRAILLDWLIEVCEVYKLHRETFYLAVDYLDRYLHAAENVQKTHLQLIGITCLFVAAKVEEIYPPKIGEFAYVTDGACTERDILNHEKILLQALDWDISPITITGWLGVYMQLNANNRTPASFAQMSRQKAAEASTSSVSSSADDAFIYPQFSGYEFVQTSQLLDLCTLDVGMANYSYSVLAAAAISHTFNREVALRCSGLDWQVIQPCAHWMEPFFRVISKKAAYLQLNEQNEQVTNKFGLAHVCPNIVTDDSHIIQTHTTTMEMYDEVLMGQDAVHAMRARTQASPATALRAPESLLTPPASSHKPDEDLRDEGEESTSKSGANSSAKAAGNCNAQSHSHLAVSSSHRSGP
ncbi:hypothetical protein KR018_004674, partial [Drosophila ironensis]